MDVSSLLAFLLQIWALCKELSSQQAEVAVIYSLSASQLYKSVVTKADTFFFLLNFPKHNEELKASVLLHRETLLTVPEQCWDS